MSMKIGVIGATGNTGRFIMAELLLRGYHPVAIVRDARKLSNFDGDYIESDIFALTASDLAPFDVIINAFCPAAGSEHLHVLAAEHLVTLISALKQTRLISVGGAGSLYTDNTRQSLFYTVDTFPQAYYALGKHSALAYHVYEQSLIPWTLICPAADYDLNGVKTSQYLIGDDYLIFNNQGHSYISYADYAYALVDEIENKAFIKKRMTVISNQS